MTVNKLLIWGSLESLTTASPPTSHFHSVHWLWQILPLLLLAGLGRDDCMVCGCLKCWVVIKSTSCSSISMMIERCFWFWNADSVWNLIVSILSTLYYWIEALWLDSSTVHRAADRDTVPLWCRTAGSPSYLITAAVRPPVLIGA